MKPPVWYRTGDCRISPWWFGIMRAEFMERRDFPGYSGTMEDGTFQTRWVGAGRLPAEMDVTSPFGFWSTMATPVGDSKTFGDRALWRGFLTYFRSNTPGPPRESGTVMSDTVTVPAGLKSLLATMKAAKEQGIGMWITERDILRVTEAIATIEAIRSGDARTAALFARVGVGGER